MNFRMNILHSIIHRHPGRDQPPRTIDVHVNRLFRRLRLEEEELGRDHARHGIGNFAVDANDSFSEKTGVYVEGSFAGGAAFEDYGYEISCDGCA
jgi:hypothetical protein